MLWQIGSHQTGKVPRTVAGMAAHATAFLDALGLTVCDVLGFSLGEMVAQQMVLDSPVGPSQNRPCGQGATRRRGHPAP